LSVSRRATRKVAKSAVHSVERTVRNYASPWERGLVENWVVQWVDGMADWSDREKDEKSAERTAARKVASWDHLDSR
jgi:hypothetical protein